MAVIQDGKQHVQVEDKLKLNSILHKIISHSPGVEKNLKNVVRKLASNIITLMSY